MPLRIVGNRSAPNNVKGERLGVQRGGCRDKTGFLHFIGASRNPVHYLHPAVTAANKRGELLHPKIPQQHSVYVHRIRKCIARKMRTVWLPARRINRHRTGSPLATAENIRAYYVEMVGVNRSPGTNHTFPPSTRLRFAGTHSGNMRISRQRVADEYDIIVAHRRSAFFITDVYGVYRCSTFQAIPVLRQLQA